MDILTALKKTFDSSPSVSVTWLSSAVKQEVITNWESYITELQRMLGTRIFIGWAPEKTPMPYLNIFPLDGGMNNGLPFEYPFVQFSCFSESLIQARQVKKKVENIFIPFKGLLGGQGGVKIIECIFNDENFDYESNLTPPSYHAATVLKFTVEE
jgi:hypothetical protein